MNRSAKVIGLATLAALLFGGGLVVGWRLRQFTPTALLRQNRQHYVDYAHGHPDPQGFGDDFKWQERGPLDFLNRLKSQVEGSYTAEGIHHAWIQAADIPLLINLLDSKVPCSSVEMTISSDWGKHGSTVGREAANLIEGFRCGVFPHALNSASWQLEGIEVNRFDEWCRRFMRNYASQSQ